jgi:formamidopyrimidine-DNA glycosylase
MPELPEIETVKLQLQKAIVGREIVQVEVRGRKSFEGEVELVEGKKIIAVRRMAKVLLVDLEGEITMAFHFKMTGQLIYDKDGNSETYKDRVVGGHPTEDFVGKLPSAHTRVIFKLDQGTLYFNDQRMFGWVKAGKKEEIEAMKFLVGLGPEPFGMTEEEFRLRVGKPKRPIKLVIMDQEIIAGVGNIYANDALWEAKIDPKTPANTLTGQQLDSLFEKVKLVLEEGIKFGGATAADAKYINLHGLGGHYQDHFRVYDREGTECPRKDGGKIKKTVLGGRGTYFCPECQK